MSSSYRPQSPDLSAYAPRSPHLSQANAYRPQSPDLSGLGSPKIQGGYNPHLPQQRSFPAPGYGNNGYAPTTSFQPTSIPTSQPVYDQQYQQYDMPPHRGVKPEAEDEYMPDASARPMRGHQQPAPQYAMASNGFSMGYNQQQSMSVKTEPVDPTHGVVLKTSFPVARIKRIMQADEDIGKVAQVTPHVVSRALELFMIKLITASAEQARGPAAANGAAKSSKRVLVQHMKRAIQADETFDFLAEIIGKVPDAPAAKAKKEAGSDSDEVKPKKKGRKRKDSADDF